jgi:hypothetical protein
MTDVRKISMSLWVNDERGAAEIRRGFVYSRKPNPAFLAVNTFEQEHVRADLLATRRVFEKYHWSRAHLLLEMNSPATRPVQTPDEGEVVAIAQVGGLHPRYERRAA